MADNEDSIGKKCNGCIDSKAELKNFDALFATLQNDLASVWQGNSEVSDAIQWFKMVNEYNVPFGKKNRGMAVVEMYHFLVKDNVSEENLNLARILGWCIEWLQAYFLVADDVMDHSLTRRGKPCWYKQNEVGLVAINDSFYLEGALFVVLKKYFRSLPCYVSLIELFHETILQTVFGQNLDLLTSPSTGVDFSRFTIERYQAIVKWKTSFYSFYLPCACALYLAGIYDQHDHDVAKTILLKLGEFFQIQDDYLDCFGDPEITGKIGTDIEDNKCSWLIVQALSRANSEQRQLLAEHYARREVEHVQKVKEIYRDLNLMQLYQEYEETSYLEIMGLIDQLSTNNHLPKEMFVSFARKFYKRTK